MREATITVMGYVIVLRYTVYDGGYIEWVLKNTSQSQGLLATLLRVHYTNFIESELRKIWFENEYEQNAINSAQLNLLKGIDYEEDTPW